ncbi:MAG: hypothetical protein ACFB12_26520 [Leptolyngbyaceae cyanobacterium]
MTSLRLDPKFALNPYLALGWQANPFALGEPVMAQSMWIDRGWSQAPAPAAQQLVQVMGDRGFGKTAHLRYWQAQTGGIYAYYPPGWGRFKVPPVQNIAYWDEADRIPKPLLLAALGQTARTRATLVAGTHTDLSPLAKLSGLAVKTICLPPLEAATLRVWAERQIQAVRLPAVSCGLELLPATVQEIAAIAQGSWRAAADELHIWAAAIAHQAVMGGRDRGDLVG